MLLVLLVLLLVLLVLLVLLSVVRMLRVMRRVLVGGGRGHGRGRAGGRDGGGVLARDSSQHGLGCEEEETRLVVIVGETGDTDKEPLVVLVR